jgi:alkaline ceramidase
MLENQYEPIDWCEPNYIHSKYIAEFWNTLSNVMFLILGYYGIKYCKQNRLVKTFYVLFIVYILVGIFSAYFHASLTLFGQLLDEIGIYLVIIVGLCSYMNINILFTLPLFPLLFIYPSFNPYILFALGFSIMYKVCKSYSEMSSVQKNCALTVVIMFMISLCFWIFDKMCYYEGTIHTHFIFHITIAITGFMAIIFLDYVKNHRINHRTIRYVFDIV